MNTKRLIARLLLVILCACFCLLLALFLMVVGNEHGLIWFFKDIASVAGVAGGVWLFVWAIMNL